MKHITKNEAEELWFKVRDLLVELGYMNTNGISKNEADEKLCFKFRHLLLVEAVK